MLNTDLPAVSVVMPVHNALPYLDAAVESILAQTFADFEFVILDDGSSDGSTERLREWAGRDPRIRLSEEPVNLGPALSSQRVASAARAPLVARMDADDLSHRDRLLEQVKAFEAQPEAGVIATLCDFIDTEGRTLRGAEPWRLARRSPLVPFAHGAMMYRRSVFDRAGGYRRESEYWEDQDLVTRMAALAPVLILPKSLYRVRLSATSTRAASRLDALEHAVDNMFRSTAGREPSEAATAAVSTTDKVDPRVFVSLGSQLLWARGRPRLFRRLLKRGKLSLNFHTFSALVWTGWASLSPGSLRAFLRSLLFARNSHAALVLKGDAPVRWHSSRSSPKVEDAAGSVESPIRVEEGSQRATHPSGAPAKAGSAVRTSSRLKANR